MKILPSLIATVLLVWTLSAHAEKADRDKPIQVEAQKITIDDAKKIQILEGNVVLTKGSIIIQSDRLVITEDAYGFQKGTAFGGPGGLARFRQKREGREEYVDGEAERIEYDTRSEIAELFHRAWISSGEDQIKGDYIWYDSIGEKYLATAGETRDPKAPPTRVRAILTPKTKTPPPTDNAPPPRGERLRLQGADEITAPPSSPGPLVAPAGEPK